MVFLMFQTEEQGGSAGRPPALSPCSGQGAGRRQDQTDTCPYRVHAGRHYRSVFTKKKAKIISDISSGFSIYLIFFLAYQWTI